MHMTLDDAMLEHVACNLCGSDDTAVLFVKDKYSIRKCTVCGLVYVSPRIPAKALASDVYDEKYFNAERGYGIEDGFGERNEKASVAASHEKLNHIEKFIKPGTLLDVGCAGGWFLLAAKERGWIAEGYEISDFAASYAREKHGFKIATGDFSHAEGVPQGAFDLVAMSDVIEHFPDPMRALSIAAKALKPRGALYVLTPNFDGLPARIQKQHWGLVQPEHHLYYFTPATLRAMLERNGFEIVAVRYRYLGLADLLFSAGALSRAGINISDESKQAFRGKTKGLRDSIRKTINTIDSAIAAPLFRNSAIGVNIEMLAKKKS